VQSVSYTYSLVPLFDVADMWNADRTIHSDSENEGTVYNEGPETTSGPRR